MCGYVTTPSNLQQNLNVLTNSSKRKTTFHDDPTGDSLGVTCRLTYDRQTGHVIAIHSNISHALNI